jgi:DNA modification methylase
MADVKILHGDCREQLKTLPDNSIDSIVTDPPYGLSNEPDMAEVLRHWLNGDDYEHNGKGFMGKSWDSFVPGPSVWRECLRVLKPGGYMLAFFGTRTYDMGVTAIRLAGFQVRDQIAWTFGSGFPKSLNVSKAIDAHYGAERTGGGRVWSGGARSGGISHGGEQEGTSERIIYDEPATDEAKQWDGWGTALKPAMEPIVVARKPLEGTVAQNVLKWGVGGLNIDASRVPTDSAVDDPRLGGKGSWKTDKAAQNVYEGEYAGEEIESSPLGRWPANLIHDGSKEVVELFPQSKGQQGEVKGTEPSHTGDENANTYGEYKRVAFAKRKEGGKGGIWSSGNGIPVGPTYIDSGSAARFFYCAKASPQDRNDGLDNFVGGKTNDGRKKDADNAFQRGASISKNTHPTVKPTELMIHLCKLITPTGGTVLDPFMGSGSTGRGAVNGGFNFIGIEMNNEYIDIAKARIAVVEKKIAEIENNVSTYNNLFKEE